MANLWQRGTLIGRRTYGSVYVATNGDNGTICAAREVELPPHELNSVERLRQLEQEIDVLRQLRHPNIVQYYGSEMIEGQLYIFMEYVHPGSLIQERFGLITEVEVRQFTHHILSGLAYLHSNQIVHRNIRGANLLVDQAGVLKLADFGIAKHLTVPLVPGKLRAYWMAPEFIQASVNIDDNSNLFSADIWSLGCTIIEMLTGKPPWGEYESVAAMFMVLRATPPIPETLSLEGRDFLRFCFERNPANRPGAAMLLEHPFVKDVTDVL
ncbi:hypothetical protein Lal_00033441 [Lupinus albus]|nr:hypothetical protein Lal_00033441 [Lupinus albus]